MDPHGVLLNLSNKINLKINDKYVDLSNLSIYYTWRKKIKNHTKTINLKNQLQLEWQMNDKFELPDGLYSVSDIQDDFEYIIKKHETIIDNSPIRI